MDNQQSQKLEKILGVGKVIARDFCSIGIKKIADLKGKDPEKLYLQICAKRGEQVDKCMLYVCRSSVYFAETKTSKQNHKKLNWWNWKDK